MRCLFFILFLSALSISHAQQKTTLEEGFMSPPDSIRTGTFWYWISDNISKEGAIADLHAMKKAGINLPSSAISAPATTAAPITPTEK